MTCPIHEENACMRSLKLDRDKLIKLQGIFKGALVRKQFRNLRAEYKSVVSELDDPDIVVWHRNSVCFPRLLKPDRTVNGNYANEKDSAKQTQFEYFQSVQNPERDCKPRESITNDSATCNQQGQEIQLSSTTDNIPKNNHHNDKVKDSSSQTHEIHKDMNVPENTDSKVQEMAEMHHGKTSQKHIQVDEHFNRDEEGNGAELNLQKPSSETENKSVHPADVMNSSFSSTLTNVTQCELTKQDLRGSWCRIGKPLQDSFQGNLHENTSMWESDESFQNALAAAPSRESLEKLRSQVALEFLWVQQAIQSRKQYLRMKEKI